MRLLKKLFETCRIYHHQVQKRYAETAMRLAQFRSNHLARDLLTNVLIQGGLRGMSTAGKGGTLANLASAFEAPVASSIKTKTQLGKQL